MSNAQTTVSFCPSQAKIYHRSFAPDLTRWHGLIAAIRNPDVELDCETFAGIWSEYIRLKARGVAFDPMLVALLTLLSRQVMLTDAGVEDFAPLAMEAA